MFSLNLTYAYLVMNALMAYMDMQSDNNQHFTLIFYTSIIKTHYSFRYTDNTC